MNKNQRKAGPSSGSAWLLLDERQAGYRHLRRESENLKNRVRSYFSGSHDAKTQRLVSEIEDFEYIVTSSNIEALILEMNLIKKYDPKYNVMLKDDKSYPFIKITNERHPKLIVTRKVKKTKAAISGRTPMSRLRGKQKAAGPPLSAQKVRQAA